MPVVNSLRSVIIVAVLHYVMVTSQFIDAIHSSGYENEGNCRAVADTANVLVNCTCMHAHVCKIHIRSDIRNNNGRPI